MLRAENSSRSGRDADHDGTRLDVAGDDRTGSNDGAAAHSTPLQDAGRAADGDVRGQLDGSRHVRPGVDADAIAEHSVMADGGVVVHLTVLADPYIAGDVGMAEDETTRCEGRLGGH